MAFTEEMLLPSRGIIYRLQNFDGTVNVRPFTTKAYKDLLTANASDTGMKQFIDTCLVDCPIKSKNLSSEDLIAVLFKARVMTLGNTITQKINCPSCKYSGEISWDLNTITVNYLNVEKYPIPIKLPTSGEEIKVRFPTGADLNKAKQEAEKRASTFNKQSSEFIGTYNTVALIDVEGKDIIEKAEWYERLAPMDAIYIDSVFAEMGENMYGVKMTRDVTCPACERSFVTYVDIGSDFFRADRNVSIGVTRTRGNLVSAT